MSNPKVSVVIPVYNACDYIDKCVSSLLSQTFSDFEIILIDDGSSDSSYDICKKLEEYDDRIRTFHQVNMGVSAARLSGVKESKGDFILFVDSDDTVEKNIIKILYDKIILGYDIVQCETTYNDDYDGKEFVRKLMEHKAPPNIWGKLIRKDFLSENIMFVPREINIGEDLIINIRLGLIVNRVYSISMNLYNYNVNPKSVMSNREVSIRYEELFLDYVHNILGNDIHYYYESFLCMQISSLEVMIVSKLSVDYKIPWISKAIKDSKRLSLNRRQWIVVNIKNSFVARYILAAERRIKLLLS